MKRTFGGWLDRLGLYACRQMAGMARRLSPEGPCRLAAALLHAVRANSPGAATELARWPDAMLKKEARRALIELSKDLAFQQAQARSRIRELYLAEIFAGIVFVDGDHGYDAAQADTAKAFEVLAPGGIIVWHDYAAKSPGVYRFFEEFTRERSVFRISKTCLLLHVDGVDPLAFEAIPMSPSKGQRNRRKQQQACNRAA